MFDDRKSIEKWRSGPKGFVDKANRQLDAIAQRLPGVRVGQALLGKHPITALQVDTFWAKITGSAANGDNKWKYAWTEQLRTASGWEDLTDGRTGTTSDNFALNSIEANNSATGTQGNSVDIDGTIFDDNTGLTIQPVEGNPVVRMHEDLDPSGVLAYSFEYVNAVDGSCG